MTLGRKEDTDISLQVWLRKWNLNTGKPKDEPWEGIFWIE